MKITAIKLHLLRVQLKRAFWMSLEPIQDASEILVRIETDEGISGIGEIHGRPLKAIAAIIREVFAPLLLGRDPLATETIYEDLFLTTCTRPPLAPRGKKQQPQLSTIPPAQTLAAIAGIDIALWDIKGKSLGLPVFRLLGGQEGKAKAYASGGYYGPRGEAAVEKLVAEMRGYVGAGYKAVKMKIGGLPLREDVRRVQAVREAVGPDICLFLDANQAYDVPAAIAAAKAFAPFGIDWLEEPVRWYDAGSGLKQVALSTHIPIASGESEIHRWGCRDLIDHGGIRLMQFDSTRAGGITEWLKITACAAANGVLMAPHHDPQIHAHLVAAASNGYIVEAFPNRERDPFWDRLYLGRPEIRAGVVYLSERPGFGFEIDPVALKKFGRRIA